MPAPAFPLRLPARWGNVGALGHVTNAVSMTSFEPARLDSRARLTEARRTLVWVGHVTDLPAALPGALRGQP